VSQRLRYANGTYERDQLGVWRYSWGDPVPGARDLTLADLLAIHASDVAATRELGRAELEWLAGEREDIGEVLLQQHGDRTPTTGDLVVGMAAPELHVQLMLTVADVADLAHVSKATIDSYRSRGTLPEPQVQRGRTPLWSRPVIQRWLTLRPGAAAEAARRAAAEARRVSRAAAANAAADAREGMARPA
jgi:predicted DNA-binding transcriptional regulator AlpA